MFHLWTEIKFAGQRGKEKTKKYARFNAQSLKLNYSNMYSIHYYLQFNV